MSRVILYKGKYMYDTVNVFAEEMGTALADLGYSVDVIDMRANSGRAQRQTSALSCPFDFAVSFGAIGTLELPVYGRLSAPFVGVLVDHPSNHLGRFRMENMILTCYDRSHVTFLKKYFDGRKRVEFLPQGGSAAGDGNPSADRPIDILFPGSYGDPDAAYAELRSTCAPEVFDVLDFVVERLLVTDCEPMEDALTAVLSAEDQMHDWKRLCGFLPMVETFVKAYKRLEVLRRLDQAGIAVDVLGGWPRDLFSRHAIRSPVTYRELLSLMHRSKIVLNMGFVPDGAHERIFSSMLNGAVPASDYNPYLDELLGDGEECLLFRWTQLERLPGRLAELLADEARLSERSQKASEVGKTHTWAARAASLLEIVRQPSS